MADVNKPDSSEAQPMISSPGSNGAVTTDPTTVGGAEPLVSETPSAMGPPPFQELILQLHWIAGLLIVVCGGWGLIALALYLTRNGTQDVFLVIGVAAAISLVFFLGMEYKQLLTRLTGLRPFSADPFGVKSGLLFLADRCSRLDVPLLRHR